MPFAAVTIPPNAYSADTLLGVTNVKDPVYGAAGNGVTDDKAAIQTALTVVSTNGGTLYFPAGTYIISSGLIAAQPVPLQPWRIVMDPDAVLKAQTGAPAMVMLTVQQDSGEQYPFILEGGAFEPNSVNVHTCLRLINTVFACIKNFEVIGAGAGSPVVVTDSCAVGIDLVTSGAGFFAEGIDLQNVFINFPQIGIQWRNTAGGTGGFSEGSLRNVFVNLPQSIGFQIGDSGAVNGQLALNRQRWSNVLCWVQNGFTAYRVRAASLTQCTLEFGVELTPGGATPLWLTIDNLGAGLIADFTSSVLYFSRAGNFGAGGGITNAGNVQIDLRKSPGSLLKQGSIIRQYESFVDDVGAQDTQRMIARLGNAYGIAGFGTTTDGVPQWLSNVGPYMFLQADGATPQDILAGNVRNLYNNQGALANAGTIGTQGYGLVAVQPSNLLTTGAILQAPAAVTQQTDTRVIVLNSSATNYVQFAAVGTSNVLGGTAIIIPPNSARMFVWGTGAQWFPVGQQQVISNSGTAQIAATGTNVAVNHGLPTTPTRVFISQTSAAGAVLDFYADTYGATQFTIRASGATVNNTNFDWRAQVGEG